MADAAPGCSVGGAVPGSAADCVPPGGRLSASLTFAPSGVETVRAAAVESGDGQLCAGAEPPDNDGQVVLWQGENYRDRLDLSDDHDAVRVARLHVVARIDLPQSDPAGNRRDNAAI